LASEGISKEAIEINFINRLTKDDYKVTLEVDLPVKILKQKINLQFLIYNYESLKTVLNWGEFVSENIRGTKGIIIMFNTSIEATLSWVSQMFQIIKENMDYVPPILLVGIKEPLESREISKEEIDQLKKINELSSSTEISLKTGENVEMTFIKLTELMMGKIKDDFKVEIKKFSFLKEHKILALLLFITIIGLTFLLSWFMYYLINIA
jgi:hypothetical protein